MRLALGTAAASCLLLLFLMNRAARAAPAAGLWTLHAVVQRPPYSPVSVADAWQLTAHAELDSVLHSEATHLPGCLLSAAHRIFDRTLRIHAAKKLC